MKFFLYFFTFSLVINAFTLTAQTDFEPYFIYQKGAKIKLGHYNIRRIPLGYTIYEIEDVNETDTMSYLTLKVDTQDKYGRPLNSGVYSAKFFEGEISIEKLFMLPVDTFVNIDQENYNIVGRDFIIPAFLGNGIAISSAWVELSDGDSTAYKVSEYSRMVDKFENIETGIGDFDACVISSKLETNFGETELLTVQSWYSKGIGPVRVNYYNTKRKLIRYSEIIEMQIPGKS